MAAVFPCFDCASRRARTNARLGFCIERRFDVGRLEDECLGLNLEMASEVLKELAEDSSKLF